MKSALVLAAFDLWVFCFPMGGFLLPADSGILVSSFLMVHGLSLVLTARFLKLDRFETVSRAAVAVTIIVTCHTPFLPDHAWLLLPVVGLSSAPVSIRACCFVKESRDPILSAGIGLGAAIALALAAAHLHVPPAVMFPGLTACLVPVLLFPCRQPAPGGLENLGRYAPFIFVFYLTGGLMFSFMLGFPDQAVFQGGIHFMAYVLLLLAAIPLARKNGELLLVPGIILGALAFSLLHFPQHPMTNGLSMCLHESSLVLVDFFLLSLLLSCTDSIRAFGYGLGIAALGLFSGSLIAAGGAHYALPVAVLGDIVIVVSLLLLFLFARKEMQPGVPVPVRVQVAAPGNGNGDRREEPLVDNAGNGDRQEALPVENTGNGATEKKLSEREMLVVQSILAGRTFKETAAQLGISESSVKTYMKRIYEKKGVHGKDALMEMLSRAKAS